MDVKVGVGGGDGGGGYGGGKGSGSTKCGRWNPTGEQVKVLTELFRSGLRTPSSDQIQKISHQLSFYGNIESKNVFYWFQNHKARERQKRRKVSNSIDHHHHHHHPPIPIQYIDTTHQHFIHHHHHHSNDHSSIIISSPNNFEEMTDKGVMEMEPERMRKTLQLFPLNSVDEVEAEAEAEAEAETEADDEFIRVSGKQYKIEAKMDHPPLLDLRLSFM